MARYPDTMRLTEALPEHFQRSGFPKDGGHASRWVPFKVLGIPLAFPNFDARREVVRYHDAHHVLTGYDTDWPGEMEISAWEIATGCAHSWVALMLNSSALALGLVAQPRRTFRAWCRGRRCRNLYREPFDRLLTEKLGDLRKQIALDRLATQPGWDDRVSFVAWAGFGMCGALGPVVASLAIAAYLA